MLRFIPSLLILLVLLMAPASAAGQGAIAQAPRSLEILGISVEGVSDDYTRGFVQQTSGLTIGEQVVIPGDPQFADAIRSIYRLGTYDDVRIVEDRRVGNGIYLAIQVSEVPKLDEYNFTGLKKGEVKDLRKTIPLISLAPVRQATVARAEQVIDEFLAEKGFPLNEIDVVRTEQPDNTVSLMFNVDKGPKVKVGEVRIEGNEELSDRTVRKVMKTKPRVGWKFWRGAKFKEDEFEEDIARIVERYNERGYFDAEVVRDTTFIEDEDGKPYMVVGVEVREGPQFHVRNVTWEGNTLYDDETLSTNLGFTRGDVYNGKQLDQNLYMNGKNTDIYSLYQNRGYMRFNVQPTISVAPGDSLDLHFDVFEGDEYQYGTITINGNTKTKEHVVRRELLTIPGQTFSRDQIQESIRRLMQLNYFTQESLAAGPGVEIAEEDKSVDLEYTLEETGTDQLELSGTWGRFGLVLQLRFGFNNFSAQNLFKGDEWRPLPSGDGQRLSVGIQTNGRQYQQYSLSYTEPWFGGRPRPAGFSLSFSQIDGAAFIRSSRAGKLQTFSSSVFYERRLSWPDQFFSTGTNVGFQYFNNEQYISTLPQGVSRQVTVKQTLSRNSTNHPLFPSSGSRFSLSLEVAPPVGDLIQFHKWRLTNSWNTPLTRKLSIGLTADYGYIGSLTGDEVEFERFVVGGSPFETQGFFSFFGKEVIYMRGYPLAALGPRDDQNEPLGGRILNRYTGELRWMAVQSQQLQAAPYLFATGANTWDRFDTYNPSQLFRAAGMGVRLFLPILGMVELAYGYNFDTFAPINSRHDGTNRWTFQFSLGQGFGQ
ncbi:MAG: outer membrane protein assembly factor BamA [Rhodothermales bacterium]|nr:outer membrane protein assembly factor BamA [Rhodothermales bacterium]MBO6779807.1 outer membrane protein assembly factor BamA [Rhodothermales bacterium]